MARPLKLLTIAHSYGVALNRRLAHEMARAGAGQWEVTAVAPKFFQGDLRPVALEAFDGEVCHTEAVKVYFSGRIHFMLYDLALRESLRQKWDMVHCWEEPYIAAGAQIARWTPPQTPLVFATFQNIPKKYPPPFSWGERYAMNKAQGWIAFGRTIEEALCKNPLYTHKPHAVIPLGVDTQVFSPRPAARRQVWDKIGWNSNGPPVIGFLGRFVPEKGLPLLLRVLDDLPTAWRALFVGSGAWENKLREWAAQYGERVRVVTGVHHDEAANYLNAMDILCAPSQTTARWREQLGRMLIEAFACRVAVAASASGEIPHVVADAGLVLPENDTAAWRQALSCLLENPVQRQEWAHKGYTRAHEVYAWPKVARQHLDFFAQLRAVR